MSLYESGDSSGKVSLEKLCRGELAPAMTGDVDLRKLIELILRGGWPGSLGLPLEQAMLLPAEYLNAVIDDVTASNERISAVTGVTPTLIRCPYGEYDDHVIAAIRSMGMEPIQWDVEQPEMT